MKFSPASPPGATRNSLPLLNVIGGVALALCLAAAPLAHAQDSTPAPPDAPDAVATPDTDGTAEVLAAPGALGAPETQNLPANELTPQVMFQTLAAEIALQRGQLAPAFQTYLALANETHDPRMAQRAAEIALAAQSAGDALSASTLWHQFAPESMRAMQLNASLLVLNGKLSEAEPMLVTQLSQVPEGERGASILSLQALIGRGPDRIGGVQTLQRLLANDMQRPEAQYAIGRQQMLASDQPAAAESFRAALRLRADFAPAALSLAQLGDAQRREAIDIITAFVDAHTSKRDALRVHDSRIVLAQLYLMGNDRDAARAQFEAMRRADSHDPSPVLALGLMELDAKHDERAQQYFLQYVELAKERPGFDPAGGYLNLAQIELQRKNLPAADNWLQKIDPASPQYVQARVGRAEILAQNGQYDQARAMLDGVSITNARDAIALGRADAAILVMAKRYPEAKDKLAALVSLAPDEPDLLYDYAMVAERTGDYALMENELRRLMVLDPDNPQAYNALGYSLADRNQRLDEADKLVGRALQLAPNDAYIVDSAGWVKFRRGDPQGALTLLKQANEHQPNAEIGAHLGEVLWSLGRHDEALTAWRDAARLDPNDETLRGTLKRFGVDLGSKTALDSGSASGAAGAPTAAPASAAIPANAGVKQP